MSFAFTATGTPKECIAETGKQAANLDQIPNGFADAINDQLGRLPGDAEVTMSCNGHTGWPDTQQAGEISLHVVINARLPVPPKPEKGADPLNPGAERFPEGFTHETPAGPGAGEPTA